MRSFAGGTAACCPVSTNDFKPAPGLGQKPSGPLAVSGLGKRATARWLCAIPRLAGFSDGYPRHPGFNRLSAPRACGQSCCRGKMAQLSHCCPSTILPGACSTRSSAPRSTPPLKNSSNHEPGTNENKRCGKKQRILHKKIKVQSALFDHHMRWSCSVFPTKTTYSPCALVGVRNTRELAKRQRDPRRPTFFLSASPEQVDPGGSGLTKKDMTNALSDQLTGKDQEDQT